MFKLIITSLVVLSFSTSAFAWGSGSKGKSSGYKKSSGGSSYKSKSSGGYKKSGGSSYKSASYKK